MALILLIDDNDSLRDILMFTLAGAGYDVVEAADGRQGIRLLEERSVDLVITDIMMPDLDGIETIIRMRRSHPDLPVITMSGDVKRNASLYLGITAKLGAVHTLHKPFSSTLLLKVVDEALGTAD